jgi:hypothetical protein
MKFMENRQIMDDNADNRIRSEIISRARSLDINMLEADVEHVALRQPPGPGDDAMNQAAVRLHIIDPEENA